jgi:hypothetical protein
VIINIYLYVFLVTSSIHIITIIDMWQRTKNRFYRLIFQDDSNYVNANYEDFFSSIRFDLIILK